MISSLRLLKKRRTGITSTIRSSSSRCGRCRASEVRDCKILITGTRARAAFTRKAHVMTLKFHMREVSLHVTRGMKGEVADQRADYGLRHERTVGRS